MDIDALDDEEFEEFLEFFKDQLQVAWEQKIVRDEMISDLEEIINEKTS